MNKALRTRDVWIEISIHLFVNGSKLKANTSKRSIAFTILTIKAFDAEIKFLLST